MTQIGDERVVNEYNGNLIANAVGGLKRTCLFVTVYDTTIDSVNPQFSLEVDARATIMSELKYEGSNDQGSVDGQLWLRYGVQTPYVTINGVSTRFECEPGIIMVERGSESSSRVPQNEILNEEVWVEESDSQRGTSLQ